MLGSILRAIIELHGTNHWPEASLLLLAVLKNYHREIRPQVIVLDPRKQAAAEERELTLSG